MGTGLNGTFDKTPDVSQWAMLCVFKANAELTPTAGNLIYGPLIHKWIALFSKESYTLFLSPKAGHGKWDGKNPFGPLPAKNEFEGKMATLTRATIRINKLSFFWKNVAPVASKMATAKGFIFSVGIGEIPWIKQATFSVWESAEDMKAFAYGMKEHAAVIQKTRKEDWYSEDMFVRFMISGTYGTINGLDPIRLNA